MTPVVKFEYISGKSYEEVWNYQKSILAELVEKKVAARRSSNSDQNLNQLHRLLFCEHHHVYTLGKSGSEDHLIISEERREKESIEYFKINRGGDITYHGPGQITGYPIFDLDDFFTDIHKYVRFLEEVIIRTIAEYGLTGIRLEGYTGVWLPPNGDSDKYRKICAIGVHLSRWVTMHGFAFNVGTDLTYFDHIIPCGIIDPDKTVTSLEQEIGKPVIMEEVISILLNNFQEIFGFEYVY